MKINDLNPFERTLLLPKALIIFRKKFNLLCENNNNKKWNNVNISATHNLINILH